MSEEKEKKSKEYETAETEKLKAETERIKRDLKIKELLQPKELAFQEKKYEVQLEKLEAEAKKAKYEANLAELSYTMNKREDEKVTTSDRQNRVYRFSNAITDSTVADCILVMTRWSRLDPGCSMEIVFCSPGGSIVDGFALFDFIKDLRRAGHKITTKTIGYAASMAGVLLQAGEERVMGRESWLLIHEASFGIGGKMGEVTDLVDWVKKMCERIVEIYAERAEEKTGKSKKTIINFIHKNWKRKDWWISATEALEYGFCDRVE